MGKKGITLVELLAALVLFGIVIALVSTILTTIIRANKEIQITTQANAQGNYLVTVLESELSKFELDQSPTNCTGTSCQLISLNRFVLVDESLTLNTDVMQLSITQETNALRIVSENLTDSIIISNRLYTVDYFQFNLSIAATTLSNKLRIQITIELIDEYMKPHIYLVSYIYQLP